MKKRELTFIVLLIFLTAIVVFVSLNSTVVKDETSENNSEIIDSKEKEQLVEDITSDINEEYDSDELEDTKKEEKNNKEYDEYLVASGYSGASDNVYYTKDGVLYHLVLSTKEIVKIAEGVSKIEKDKETILVYKGNSFKILKDDNYLTYVD